MRVQGPFPVGGLSDSAKGIFMLYRFVLMAALLILTLACWSPPGGTRTVEWNYDASGLRGTFRLSFPAHGWELDGTSGILKRPYDVMRLKVTETEKPYYMAVAYRWSDSIDPRSMESAYQDSPDITVEYFEGTVNGRPATFEVVTGIDHDQSVEKQLTAYIPDGDITWLVQCSADGEVPSQYQVCEDAVNSFRVE